MLQTLTTLPTADAAADWLSSRLDAAARPRPGVPARARGSLRSDSRAVQPGDAFIAWPGRSADGRSHLRAALAAGAAACLIEAERAEAVAGLGGVLAQGERAEVQQAEVQRGEVQRGEVQQATDTQQRIAALSGLQAAAGAVASRVYGHPSARLQVLAVTGTNGKTSTAWWLAQALTQLGRRCGVVGTLGIGEPPRASLVASGEPAEVQHTGLTTPDAVALQTAFKDFADAGFSACAIEASSIGIAEQRLAAVQVAVALFTNFTRDHLDFHGDMATYWAAKRQLFAWPGLAAAVINIDDAQGVALAAEVNGSALDVWTVSLHGAARLSAQNLRYVDGGIAFDVVEAPSPAARVPACQPEPLGGLAAGGSTSALRPRPAPASGGESRVVPPLPLAGEGWGEGWGQGGVPVATQLVGDFNASNLLVAIGGLRALGVPLADAAAACAGLRPVPGRLERVPTGTADDVEIVVDYAHTPDALDKVLHALRPLAAARGGQLWCVFGCGGNRDATKRPLMGAIAAQGADRVVVTSDNPRDEVPAAILAQILAGTTGIAGHGERVAVIEDRHQAIAHAVRHAAARDVVLLAGKGHEDYQEIGGSKRPFSDTAEAAAALRLREGIGA